MYARNLKLRRTIEPIETWLRNPYYMGREAYALRKFWYDNIIDYYKTGKHEFIFSGSSRSGKSYACAILIFRLIYEIYCYESFPSLFGLSPTTLPKIYWFSYSLTKADSTGIDRLIRIIDQSPFFNDSKERKRRDVNSFVSFPWVEVYSGTSVNHAIGDDVLGAVIDEANVRHVAKDRVLEEAHNLFMEIRARSSTTYTYKGHWGGFAGIISTAATTTSFVDAELAKARADNSKFTVEAAVYDVNPEGYSDTHFAVYAGDGDIPPFIVDELSPEVSLKIAESTGLTVDQFLVKYKDNIVYPPDNLKHFYVEDIAFALRSISGKPQVNGSSLFNRKGVIDGMFNSDIINPCSEEMPLLGIYDTQDFKSMISDTEIFKYYDGENVYGHNDISKRNDHTGVSFLYYSVNLHKIMPIWYGPVYLNKHIDDNEISQTKVLGIMLALRELGVHIKYVSADWYASDYYVQQAKMILGNECSGIYSVDRNPAAYLALSAYAKMHMINLYPSKQLKYELSNLQYDRMSGKVDHPYNADSQNPVFFKDVADAVAASCFHILTREKISYEDIIVKKEVERVSDKEGLEDNDDGFFEGLEDDSEDSFYGKIASEAKDTEDDLRAQGKILTRKDLLMSREKAFSDF